MYAEEPNLCVCIGETIQPNAPSYFGKLPTAFNKLLIQCDCMAFPFVNGPTKVKIFVCQKSLKQLHLLNYKSRCWSILSSLKLCTVFLAFLLFPLYWVLESMLRMHTYESCKNQFAISV